MLQPANRLTLIDAMRPPAGFGLESAMAVTFTLDLRALLAAPAAFVLGGSAEATDEPAELEPIELIHAVRSHASKLTVLSQVGEIALPPSRKVFAFLEQAVVPVRAPQGGVVHPKVWVLRYEGRPTSNGDYSGESALRVLIASRNLTFDASWDTVIRLDESASGRGADLGGLGELFERLLRTASSGSSERHENRVASLSEGLRAARFSLPQGVDELNLHVLGLTDTASPLPGDADRSLIISPFVGDDFFADVRPTSLDELVSRKESLDLLGEQALDCVRSAYFFDDGSPVELGAETERLSARDPGRPLVGLHAKVFAFEDGRRAHAFLGSANATGAAFKSNVEVLVELVGSTKDLGIDRLCEGNDEELGLRGMFNTYARVEDASVDDEESSVLDRARRAIARLPIEGFVEESGSGWTVTYRSTEVLPAASENATIHCWPLASPGNRRRVPADVALNVRFEATLETISGFLAFEIVDESGALTGFVVPVPLNGVPERRESVLLRALVGNAERFLRYLLALLDEDFGQGGLAHVVDAAATDGLGDGANPHTLPVLEKLLRTMRRDPAKLAGLNPLITDLASDEALPPGFADVWGTIYDVAVRGAELP